ncbi:unnamed protein product [Nippostrongylus brasiliensis]|uniref:Uncharacterized protein n=1 Tax=Nippostrongylus brasiliensis TaxID=27835 RepID=A0A0N4YX08_NIPBR|nr:unnamed protein product [Nippostrongylus brasiliensis]
MALCTALLCKRNRGKKGSVKNIYYAENGAHVRRVLLEQQQKALLTDECAKAPPIGSQFFTLDSTCSPSPMHPSMTLRSAKSGYSGYSTNRNAGIYLFIYLFVCYEVLIINTNINNTKTPCYNTKSN